MAASSQSNTLVLLLLLGFLIYYLGSPCDEKFENVKKPEQPKLPINTNSVSAMTTMAPMASMAPMAQSVNTNNTVPEDVVKAGVMKKLSTSTEKPKPSGKQQSCDRPDNYDPFDPAGANLEFAFSAGMETKPDNVVDINKQNQQDYCASDFLPKENNPDWWDDGFSQAKYNMNDDKLINTERYIIGINTVGQSLKNASYDIRGTVANPKFSVSPWNNSTIEPDYNLKSLC